MVLTLLGERAGPYPVSFTSNCHIGNPRLSMRQLLPPGQCYTGEEVAAMLRISRQRFYRWRKRLEQEEGMPMAIRCGSHLRYSKAAFDAWLHTPRREPPRPAAAANDPLPVGLRERFDQEYG